MPDPAVRLAIYQHFAAHGVAPERQALAEHVGLGLSELDAALERLHDTRAIVLAPQSRDIWMAMPFSAVPTAYRVTWGNVSGFANCAWDAFGIAAALATDVTIHATDPVTGAPLELQVLANEVRPATGVVHFAVPARDWWADIGFT